MAQRSSVRTITSDTKFLAQGLEEKKNQQFQVVNLSIRLQNAILKQKILMSNHDNRIPKFNGSMSRYNDRDLYILRRVRDFLNTK